MTKFSERYGYSKVSDSIQRDYMNQDLRTALWNALHLYILEDYKMRDEDTDESLVNLKYRIWMYSLNKKVDELPQKNQDFVSSVKWHVENWLWFGVYNFIEFVLENYAGPKTSKNKVNFIEYVNNELEIHQSAYRIVNDKFIEITSKEEVESIQSSLEIGDKFNPVKKHIESAVLLMSDKKSPDYRNSIKEAISAVEALCCLIVGKKKVTLSQALKEIDKRHALHPALKASFEKLYAYTNDSSGIRHKLLEEDKITVADARFMLVSCSSFINYLIQKFEL